MKIVADDKIPFLRGVCEPFADVVYRPGRSIAPDDVRDADALIVRTRTACGPSLLAGSSIRFIASATIGFDHIDTAYCAANGITWANAPGCNAASVQQYVGSALAHLRLSLGMPLAGRTLGIVGVGHVGSRIEQLARTLGMEVLRNDPPRARAEGDEGFIALDELLDRSDIVTLHVPLSRSGDDATFHLLDARRIERLRPGQVLFNTSRGEVVDTTALAARLREQPLAACVLDVWEDEPDINRALLALVTLGTPHIAGYSADGKANGTAMSVQAVSRFFGLPLTTWMPPDVPPPPTPTLHADCSERDEEEIIASLLRSTYDIMADDRRLRASPETFEQQRSAHPLRREWPAHAVQLAGATTEVATRIRALGFTLVHPNSATPGKT